MDEDKSYQLYLGDCLEIMKNIPNKSIDMILCDLPYGTTKNKWDVIIPFDLLWGQYNRIIKDNGVIVLFAQGMFTCQLMQSQPKLWRYNLIWEKDRPSGFLNAKRMPLRSHEDICIFYKKIPVMDRYFYFSICLQQSFHYSKLMMMGKFHPIFANLLKT